jgi:hypothetical protein
MRRDIKQKVAESKSEIIAKESFSDINFVTGIENGLKHSIPPLHHHHSPSFVRCNTNQHVLLLVY